jgi:hypothetical protein
MARPARHDEGGIKVALQMVAKATTLQELRQGQVILLPALTGATMDKTTEVLGGRCQGAMGLPPHSMVRSLHHGFDTV